MRTFQAETVGRNDTQPVEVLGDQRSLEPRHLGMLSLAAPLTGPVLSLLQSGSIAHPER